MRHLLALSAAALLVTAGAAAAAPAQVHVDIGAKLKKTAVEKYGVRDVDMLAGELKTSVERRLAKTGAYENQRIELTLVDAVPNRPTFKQMSDKPGLSFVSFGVGGARIEGRAIAADGRVTPLKYQWYETSLEQAIGHSTWQDAEWTFDRFANHLGREQLASR